MSTVDNRVVRMTFDNSQFEKNVKSTMETLTEFEKKLKFDGATAGFDTIKNAADKLNLSILGKKAGDEAKKIDEMSSEAAKSIDKIDDKASEADFSALSNAANDMVADVNAATSNTDFSPLSDGAQDAAMDISNAASTVDMSPIVEEAQRASEGFSALEMVATGVLLGIGDKIAGLATGALSSVGNKIKEYTLDPIVSGFKEYETQMGSIQTIMANTGMDFNSDDDIATVNAALDELNTYADKTIYNFTEMTRNIGTFTAAGVDLETSKNAIQGIANLAALSGSNSQQASTAMYQLSQALAAGSLKLQDWNSVVNAGMGGEVFQNALKETARAHGIAVDEIIESEGSFRESLKEGWISSEILTETLNHMAISYDRASMADENYKKAYEDLISQGYEEKQAKEILRLAKVAEQSATKVRTWTQLWDTVGEAIGSQWSAIWRNFIGDFKQATDTFTFLSNSLSSGVESLLGGLVHAAEIFNKSGAIDLIFGSYKRDAEGNDFFDEDGYLVRIKGAMDYLVEAVSKPLKAIRDAFDSVFGMDDDQLAITIISIAAAFKDFTQSLVISDNAATGIRHIFEGLFSILDIGIHVVMDLGAAFFGVIDILRIFIDPLIDIALVLGGQLGKAMLWIHDKILEVREAVIYAIYPILELIGAFGDIIRSAFGFVDIPGKIEGIGDAILGVLEFLWQLIDIPGKIMLIGDALRWVFGFIGDLTGWNKAAKESSDIFAKTGEEVSAFDIWVKNLLKNPVIAFFKGIGDAIVGAFSKLGGLKDSIANLFGSGENDNAKKSVGLFDSLKSAVSGLFSILGTVGGAIVSIFGTIGSSLIPVFTVVLNVFKSIASGIGAGVVLIFTGLVSIFEAFGSALSVVGSAIGVVINSGLPELVRLFGMLWNAIGGFASRMWEFVTAWEPLKTITKTVSDFANKVIGFFTGMPNQITESGNAIAGSISDTDNWMMKFIETFEAVISYIEHLTPEKLMSDVVEFFGSIASAIPRAIDNLKGKITSAIEKVMSIDPNVVGASIIDTLANLYYNISKMSLNIKDVLQSMLPSGLGSLISDGIGSIFKTILGGISRVRLIVQRAKTNSNNILEFIATLFVNIGAEVLIGIKNLLLTIGQSLVFLGAGVLISLKSLGTLVVDSISAIFSGGGLSKLKEVFANFKDNMLTNLSEVFHGLGPSFGNLYDSIVEFFTGTSEEANHFGDLIGPAIDRVKTEFENLKPAIEDSLNRLKDTIRKFLESLPVIIPKEMAKLRDALLSAARSIADRLSNISGPIGDFFGTIRDRIDAAKETISDAKSSIPKDLNSFGKSIQNIIKNIGKSIKDFMLGSEEVGDGGFLERIKNFFADIGEWTFGKITSIPDSIGALFDSIIGIITPERIEKIMTIVKLVAQVKLFKSLRSFFGGLGSLSRAMARRISKKNAETLQDKVRSWAISLAIVAGALWVISTIKDPVGAIAIIATMGGILLALQWLSGIIQKKLGDKLGDDLMKAAASIAILAVGMMLMLKAVEALNGFDYAANWKGLVAFAAFMTLFGFWTRTLGDGGKNAHKAALAMVIMAVALRLLIKPIEDITELVKDKTWGELGKIGAGLGALALFISAMGAALNIAGKNALKNSIAFLIMAASISIIGDAIAKLAFLAVLNIDAVKVPFLGMLGLIAAFAIMAAKIKTGDLLKTSAALLIFSAAMTVLAYGIGILAGQSWESIAVASVGIVALLGALYFMTTKLKAGDLVKTSLALLAYGAALGIMCLALSSLAAVGPGLTPAAIALGAIVGIFGILAVALSSPAISAGATKVLPLLSLAFLALGAACVMIAIALNKAVEGIVKIAMVSPILVQFVSLISQNALQFGVAALALGAFGAALMIFGPGAVLAGAGLLLLSEGIRSFLMLIIELPILLQLAAESIGFMISQIPIMLGTIWENISTWFTESFLPMLQEMIPQIIDFLTNLATQAWDWLQTTGIPLLQEYGGKFWDWFKSDALPKLGEVVKGLMGKLGELATLLMGWLQNEGWPFLKKLAGDFWNWFTTEGLPKIGEAIPKVMDKLGELLSALGSWVVNDGLPAAGKAVADMVGRAKDDLGPKIKEFANDLPGHLKNAIDNIWGSIKDIGGNIVQGISEGISGGVQWIINAVNGLGGDALNAIKNFFGIASPSKLMRDEVGRYIPEGLAVGITKFSRYATDAAENLGKDSIDSINSVMNNADYATLSPSISPVMNMDTFAGNVADYNRLIRSTMEADSADINRKFSGEMVLSSDLANRLDNDISAVNSLTGAINDIRQTIDSNVSKTEYLYSKTNSLLESIGGDASLIRNSLTSGMGLYLDKNTLIGAIAPEMDTRLGQRAILAGRGVY